VPMYMHICMHAFEYFSSSSDRKLGIEPIIKTLFFKDVKVGINKIVD
jgi:hypothetical protein